MTTPAQTPSTVEDDAYRVLVVEDDPSQALFAEGVLRGAGIQRAGARARRTRSCRRWKRSSRTWC